MHPTGMLSCYNINRGTFERNNAKDHHLILTVQKHLITPLKQSLGQGYIFAPVCYSVHKGGGVCLSAYWNSRPPRADTPPPRSRSPCAVHACMLGDTVNKRAVRILLECILVRDRFARFIALVELFSVPVV